MLEMSYLVLLSTLIASSFDDDACTCNVVPNHKSVLYRPGANGCSDPNILNTIDSL